MLKKCKAWFIENIKDICFFVLVGGALSLLFWFLKDRMKPEWSWCDALSAISALIMAVGGLIGGYFTYSKWGEEKALKRSECLEKLLAKFTKDKIRNFICQFSSTGGASEFFAKVYPGSKAEREIENSLMFVSQLCSMKMSNVISCEEFSLFEDSVFRILSDDDVKRYIKNVLRDAGIEGKDSHYALLIKFAEKNGIDMNEFEDNIPTARLGKESVQGCANGQTAESRSNGLCPEVDFDRPTAIIRINQLYRDGMNDQEVYETVRGWWRLRLEVAQKVKMVIAVAHGIVRGVYYVDKWIEASDPAEAGRIGFIGKTADKSICDRFIGRSVRALFSRGAANPVKYFNLEK